MNFGSSEEQKMIVESAAKFATALRAQLRETEKNGLGNELIRQYRELGFLTLAWPAELGGAQMGWLTKAMALEELAWGDAAATLALDRASWVLSPLVVDDKLRDRARGMLKGEVHALSPAFHVDLDRKLQAGDSEVSGSIAYLPSAECDSLLLLQDDRLVSISSGLDPAPILPGALDALGASKVELRGRADWIENLTSAQAVLVSGMWRLNMAAVLVGLSRAGFEYARRYCLERVAFGKKVAHHQAVAFILADMAIAIDGARLLVQEAALDVDSGRDAGFNLQSAFLQAAECALFVTNFAVQFLASAGYVRDHPVEKWMREARAITLLGGGVDGAQADADRALSVQIQAA